MTSTQLRVSAPVFTPQQHQHQQHQQQQQHQQYFQAPLPSPYTPQSAPAYDGRGRSQSVSNHVSLTGLRISMAQSRPGNVLAPHLPLLSRASSSGGPVAVQANTYANGGYFATRRASVSNVGLAADLSHSIRIPPVLFQRRSFDPTAAAAAEAGGGGGDAEAQGGGSSSSSSSGESPAMKRLQEMISSMRALGPAPSAATAAVAKSAEAHDGPVDDDGAEDLALDSPAEVAESVAEPAAAAAAHPTSRFDSILEEDEDADDDEANLDAHDS
ncbi:hypothetical protein IWW38_006421, partial [Coemansia aciculifera]